MEQLGKIYRNVYQIEVLTSEPVDVIGLEDLLSLEEAGLASIQFKSNIVCNKLVIGSKAVDMVINHGTDPEYFNMDREGYVI